MSSRATDAPHAVEPFALRGEPAEAWRALRSALDETARTRIVEESASYLRAEFRSLVFRFVDDVEFWLAPRDGVIHVRSASRTGYGDLGVNRKRVERLREILRDAGVLSEG